MRLFSLNVERSKHLHRYIPFLASHRPDVVCLQELCADDIPRIQHETGLTACHFVQMSIRADENRAFGLGILARRPFLEADFTTYAGIADGGARHDLSTPDRRMQTCRYPVLRVCVADGPDDADEIQVATVHFPWTPDGQPRPFQTKAAHDLIAALAGRETVLTGDFNAPRGGLVFDIFAHTWKDCIPAGIITSIDPALHRAGPLQLMVDGLFASPRYAVTDVRLHTGLSDHQAITADIRVA